MSVFYVHLSISLKYCLCDSLSLCDFMCVCLCLHVCVLLLVTACICLFNLMLVCTYIPTEQIFQGLFTSGDKIKSEVDL